MSRNSHWPFCLVMFLLFFQGDMVRSQGAESEEMIQTELTDDVGAPHPRRGLARVSAVFQAHKIQEFSSGGIDFVLELFNRNRHELVVYNPLDFLRFTLLDQKGTPLNLEPRSVKFLINTKRKVVTHLFEVVKIMSDDRDVTRQDDEGAHVSLPAQGTYKIHLQIRYVRKGPHNFEPVPIKAGHYRLSYFVLPLFTEPGDEDRRNLHLKHVEIDLVDDKTG